MERKFRSGAKRTFFSEIQPYEDVPFKVKMEHFQYHDTGNVELSKTSQRLIRDFKSDVVTEQFGLKFRKGFRNKSHWVKLEKYTNSLLGEAPKGIIQSPTGERYLYKLPKQKGSTNHGFKETLTEFIITELSRFFTPTAETFLALYGGKIVLTSKIFIKEYDEELIHGTVLFSNIYDEKGIEEIQLNRDKQRRFYTLNHILEALSASFPNKAECDVIMNAFCMMVLTDCFTGNQDRHAENWGVIRHMPSNTFRFAPLFDNARGLFWNSTTLELAIRSGRDRKKMLDDYIISSKPMISLDKNENATHFDLFTELTHIKPEIVGRFVSRLGKLDIDRFIMRFRPMLSPIRSSLIVELLKKRRKRIYELVQQNSKIS